MSTTIHSGDALAHAADVLADQLQQGELDRSGSGWFGERNIDDACHGTLTRN